MPQSKTTDQPNPRRERDTENNSRMTARLQIKKSNQHSLLQVENCKIKKGHLSTASQIKNQTKNTHKQWEQQ